MLAQKPAEALKAYKELQVLNIKSSVQAQIMAGYENLAKACDALGDTKAAEQYRAKAKGDPGSNE